MNKKIYERYLSMIPNKMKWLILILGIVLFLGLIGYLMIIYGGKLVIDDEKLILNSTTTIETSDGNTIGELYFENRYLITLDQVPEHVQNAFIAIEDVRFYQHAGVDIKSVARAVYRDVISFGKVEGASTITQQLAKNLFLYNDKTWMRKTKEVMAAIYLERTYSKDEILELYLNAIYFGHGIYGIETAAQYFFSKSVEELTVAEGALMAALAKAPNGYSPINHPDKALTRRNVALKAMNNAEMISTDMMLTEQGKTLGLNVKEKEVDPWVNSYLDLVMKEAAKKHSISIDELKRGGYRIVVNIDKQAQKIAYEEFKKDRYFPGNTDGVEGAFVMLEEATGQVKVALGGRDYQLGDLNRVTVKRQPGSTFKPLAVYGPAMMTEEYEPYSLLKDEELAYGDYVARNYDDQYEGEISLYEALVKSKNTSTVWLLDQIGIDYSKDYLKKMNIDIPDEGLAIGLGGLSEGVTPLNMVEGYRAFVHDGEVVDPYTISRIYNRKGELIAEANPKSKEVFHPQVAWNMTEILSYTVKAGTAQQGVYEKALAGKTGSTEHPHVKGMVKDAWFVGYTPEYVTALWMGYDHSDQDHHLTVGGSAPTELTKAILTKIDQGQSLAEKFTKPNHVKAIPQPIELPDIKNVDVKYVFGGLSLIKGEISWTGSSDERVIYRIYQKETGIDKKIGEVVGKTVFKIDDVKLLQTNYFYIVPYDPLTKTEGEPSEVVELSI